MRSDRSFQRDRDRCWSVDRGDDREREPAGADKRSRCWGGPVIGIGTRRRRDSGRAVAFSPAVNAPPQPRTAYPQRCPRLGQDIHNERRCYPHSRAPPGYSRWSDSRRLCGVSSRRRPGGDAREPVATESTGSRWRRRAFHSSWSACDRCAGAVAAVGAPTLWRAGAIQRGRFEPSDRGASSAAEDRSPRWRYSNNSPRVEQPGALLAIGLVAAYSGAHQ